MKKNQKGRTKWYFVKIRSITKGAGFTTWGERYDWVIKKTNLRKGQTSSKKFCSLGGAKDLEIVGMSIRWGLVLVTDSRVNPSGEKSIVK